MNRKIILFFLILIIICIIFFTIIEYKSIISGNNISKSDNIDILNISSYEANVTVEVYSNKNTNKYIMNQKYIAPNIFKQEIIEPSNIKGLTITNDGENVVVENKILDLKTLYENFNDSLSNLDLMSFINEYKEGINSEKEEQEKEIILKTEITKNKNKYQMYQNLYIDKSSNLPTKMEILDINKNIKVYILYNEIKLNETTKTDIL